MKARCGALAIGGSAGSLPVIMELLSALPPYSPFAVVVCVHTASTEVDTLCRALGRRCALPVVEACERHRVVGGRVYIAAGGYHLLIEQTQHFALCVSEHVHYARPSIDVLFASLADAYRRESVGILLSGANVDGAEGLRRIHQCGGMTLVQHPDTASSPEMPAGAMALFQPDRQNTPQQLSAAVAELADAID